MFKERGAHGAEPDDAGSPKGDSASREDGLFHRHSNLTE